MTELNPDITAGMRNSATEVPFHPSEIFFSRTDKRGVISCGNGVFKRLSGYDWEELLGAPHKIIRHPDMPAGVFEVMWNKLKAGEPFGGYIKNRDKSGRFYWVFALAAPTDGGYLSVRIKPTSTMLEKIARIYSELRQAENAEGLSPRDSGERFLKTIRSLGYAGYASFQSAALASEFEARCQVLGTPMEPTQKRLLDMSRAISDVQVETAEMTEAFHAIRTVPMNMRIIASRLENAGGPISAISVNYSQMLEEMSTWVTTFIEGESCVFSRIRDAILTCQFLGFSAALQTQTLEALDQGEEETAPGFDLGREKRELESLQASFLDQGRASLGSVEGEALRFGRSVLDMKRYVTGLSSTRMMCKIESAALSNNGTALGGIVEQLDACQTEIEKRLARIVELNALIQSNTGTLRSAL